MQLLPKMSSPKLFIIVSGEADYLPLVDELNKGDSQCRIWTADEAHTARSIKQLPNTSYVVSLLKVARSSINSQTEEIRRRLLRDANDQLSAAFRTREFSAYKDSDHQIQAELDKRIDGSLDEFRRDLSSILRSEGAQTEAAHRLALQRRYFRLAVSGAIAIALYCAVAVPLRYYDVSAPMFHLRTGLSVFWVVVAAVAFALIVSVSHDALYRFLLRGLPARDVFDSAFDEIIQIALLDAAESVEVLKKRAVGFPTSWALTCYMLSGGLPRDLLRYGRRCVEIYLEKNQGVAAVMPHLIGEVAAERVGAELDAQGIVSRLTPHGRSELRSVLEASRGGSVGMLVRLVDSLNDDSLSKINDWLQWLTDVMDVVSLNSVCEKDGEVGSLARRGVLAYSGKLRW